MINWDKCVQRQTVLVLGDGIRRLFLSIHGDTIFSTRLGTREYSIHQKDWFKNARVETSAVDILLIKPGLSVLKDRDGIRHLCHVVSGECILVSGFEKDAVKFVFAVWPDIYKTWTVELYE